MKRWITAALALILCAGCAAPTPPEEPVSSHLEQTQSQQAQDPPAMSEAREEPLTLDGPVLVTSLGQSTDALLIREMLNDLGHSSTYEPVADSSSLAGYRTVLLAVRASNKALGAGKVTAAEEYSRCERLLAALPSECMPVVVLLGDSSNQDPLTDDLIELALPYAGLILATQSSDRDGEIKRYSQENQIPYRTCGTLKEMCGLLGQLVPEEA